MSWDTILYYYEMFRDMLDSFVNRIAKRFFGA